MVVCVIVASLSGKNGKWKKEGLCIQGKNLHD